MRFVASVASLLGSVAARAVVAVALLASAARPERRIVTVAHYEATLLAYYLARETGVPMDWTHVRHEGSELRLDGVGKTIVPLLESHGLEAGSGARAASYLRRLVREEPTLVLDRDAFRVPELTPVLASCGVVQEWAGGRLLRCGGGG